VVGTGALERPLMRRTTTSGGRPPVPVHVGHSVVIDCPHEGEPLPVISISPTRITQRRGCVPGRAECMRTLKHLSRFESVSCR